MQNTGKVNFGIFAVFSCSKLYVWMKQSKMVSVLGRKANIKEVKQMNEPFFAGKQHHTSFSLKQDHI